jgi:hypothetical protein
VIRPENFTSILYPSPFNKLTEERREETQRLFSTFPGGSPGFGLLILRVALGLTILLRGVEYLSNSGGPAVSNWISGFFVVGSVVFLLIGFLTPVVALIALAGGAVLFVYARQLIVIEIYALVLAAAIVLLGPGAFSLDARLFGRREIVFPKDRK